MKTRAHATRSIGWNHLICYEFERTWACADEKAAERHTFDALYHFTRWLILRPGCLLVSLGHRTCVEGEIEHGSRLTSARSMLMLHTFV